MKDSSLQFVHWLNRATEFNKEMKGNQMEEKTCFYCGSKATVEAYEVGKSVEQERIIKLLEAYPETAWCKADEYCKHRLTCHEVIDWLNNHIALIKGEK